MGSLRYMHVFGPFALAILLTAGFIKGDPRFEFLPIDLTAFGAALTFAAVTWTIVYRRLRVPQGLVVPALLFAAFLPGVFLTGNSDYAVEKVLKLFSITALCMIAPAVLFRRSRHIRNFVLVLYAIAGLIVLDTLVSFFFGADVARLAGGGTNAIGLGRLSGFVFVGAFVLWLRTASTSALGIMAGSAFALVGSGSRGPLLFAGLTAALLLTLRSMRGKVPVRAAVAVLLLVIGASSALATAPPAAVARIQSAVRGEADSSVRGRLRSYSETWREVAVTPQGAGWAGFGERVGMWTDTGRPYPHNIFLEVALEGGWIAGAALVVVFGFAFRRLRSAARIGSWAQLVAFSGLVFFGLNALVSGDINDNRILFAFLGLAWAPGLSTTLAGSAPREVTYRECGNLEPAGRGRRSSA